VTTTTENDRSCYFGKPRHIDTPTKGAVTSKIKHAIKHKTSPARLAQLLQPSLAFGFTLQPMTGRRTVHCNNCASLAGLVLCFIACFILLVIAP